MRSRTLLIIGLTAVVIFGEDDSTIAADETLEEMVIKEVDRCREEHPGDYGGVKVLAVQRPERRRARVVGLITTSGQANTLKGDITQFLKKNADSPNFGPTDAVDVDGLIVYDEQKLDNVRRLQMVEELASRFLYGSSAAKLRVLNYEPRRATMGVCGAVHEESQRAGIQAMLMRLDWVRKLDCSQVIVMDDVRTETSLSLLLSEAYERLRKEDGSGLVSVSSTMIRGGQTTPDVWYLRAVGFMLNGDEASALGALRLARGRFERGVAESGHYRLLEGFQNVPLRYRLELLIDQAALPLIQYDDGGRLPAQPPVNSFQRSPQGASQL